MKKKQCTADRKNKHTDKNCTHTDTQVI